MLHKLVRVREENGMERGNWFLTCSWATIEAAGSVFLDPQFMRSLMNGILKIEILEQAK